MKIIKGFENEDIIVSDFGEWVGKNYIDYKSEYKNNQKIIKRLLDENKQLKDNWDKLRELILEEGFEINTREYGSLDVIDKNVILEKMQKLEQGSNGK